MPEFGLVVHGIPEARAVLQAYADAAREHASTQGWSVVADAPYAAGIHEGKRRSGRLARAAGPIPFLRDAVNEVTQSGRTLDALGAGLPSGPQALRGSRQKLANDIAKSARRRLTPFPYSPRTKRRSGGLAASIHVVRGNVGGVVTAPLVAPAARVRRPR